MEYKVEVSKTVFGPCHTGHHQTCHRQYERIYFEGPKMNKLVKTGTIVLCGCTKRGCKCNGRQPEKPVENVTEAL